MGTVEAMMKKIDTSGDGVISYEEFGSYLLNKQDHIYRRNSESFNAEAIQRITTWRRDSKGSDSTSVAASDNKPIHDMFMEFAAWLNNSHDLEKLRDGMQLPEYDVLCQKHAQRLVDEHWL